MKGLLKAALAALVFASASFVATAPASAADRWIKVRNHSSVILYRFYASRSSQNSWGQDRLVSKQVPPNYTTTLNLYDAPGGCQFDLRAEFKDGDVLEKFNVNVCGGYTITYND